ncbi:MAG: class I SAM-dependent methyltransferase, partial [Anaerolineae bacterium]
RFNRVDGIWRFLQPGRAQALERFMREYETIRAAESRGSQDPAYYRALPFADLTGRFTTDWQVRAKSYQALVNNLIVPLEPTRTPLRILDLGAGNSWLSYRLSKRGHTLAAIDLLVNAHDGLGARTRYDVEFTSIQAEFDCLPLAGKQVDLAIFNSSFHYSTNYESTLSAVLPVLVPKGAVVILDTPIYSNADSGSHMVAEREAQFTQAYGFPSNAIASENYLTYDRLKVLGRNTGITWEMYKPYRGWRWAVRPWIARARHRREPAEFLLIIGRVS